MRHFFLRGLILGSALVIVASQATATPVFTEPESRFPSGEYSRAWLEDHTDASRTQKWFKVRTETKAIGWVAEDHVLSALKFVDQALVKEETPPRSAPSMDAIRFGAPIAKGATASRSSTAGLRESRDLGFD